MNPLVATLVAVAGLSLGGTVSLLAAAELPSDVAAATEPGPDDVGLAAETSAESAEVAPTTAAVIRTTITTTRSTTTTRPTTTTTTCIDNLESWAWPTTTEGPVVECPASPSGAPSMALSRPAATGWISVLESIEVWNVSQVDPRAVTLRQRDTIGLLDSRQFLLLRDPYWVLYAGPFEDREAASAFCTDRGYLDPCYPRELG